MILRKWDFIRDRYYTVEIPKTGPEPEDWGATSPVPVLPGETYRGALQQEQLKAEKLYQRRIARMKQLGLIESNPGNVQEVWASQFRHIGAENKDTIWDEIWKWVTGNIWDFLSGGRAGIDPKVAQAIEKVQAECGLTEDLEWAWSWYDRRYPKPLGNSWKGYCYYASQWALFPWDKQHYVNCATHCLNQLQNYLQAALSKAAGRPIGGIMDFLKKYGAYVAMGGAGLALVLVLATRGRAPVYIVPERR